MNRLFPPLLLLGVLLLGAPPATALDVTRYGELVASFSPKKADGFSIGESEVTARDSAVAFLLSRRLEGYYAGAALAGRLMDHNQSRVSEAYAYLGSENWELQLGLAPLPNGLIDFDTVRDEDFIAYSHVGNGASGTLYDTLYGESARFTWYPGAHHAAQVWAGRRFNDTLTWNGVDAGRGATDIDSYGANYVYRNADARLRHGGLKWERQLVTDEVQGYDQWIDVVMLGAEVDLARNPNRAWSLKAQSVITAGIAAVGQPELDDRLPSNARWGNAALSRARANATATAVGLYYRKRGGSHPWRAGFTLGHKHYPDVADARHITVMPSFYYPLAPGLTVVSNIIYTDYDAALCGGGWDTIYNLGLSLDLGSDAPAPLPHGAFRHLPGGK